MDLLFFCLCVGLCQTHRFMYFPHFIVPAFYSALAAQKCSFNDEIIPVDEGGEIVCLVILVYYPLNKLFSR